jgi:hypothetical protein
MLLLVVTIFAAVLGAFRGGYERGHVAGVQHQMDSTVETRWYSVDDLVVKNARADFQPLMQQIKSTIAPSSWNNGGLGQMAPFEPHLKLGVTHRRQELGEIENLLAELRESRSK